MLPPTKGSIHRADRAPVIAFGLSRTNLRLPAETLTSPAMTPGDKGETRSGRTEARARVEILDWRASKSLAWERG